MCRAGGRSSSGAGLLWSFLFCLVCGCFPPSHRDARCNKRFLCLFTCGAIGSELPPVCVSFPFPSSSSSLPQELAEIPSLARGMGAAGHFALLLIQGPTFVPTCVLDQAFSVSFSISGGTVGAQCLSLPARKRCLTSPDPLMTRGDPPVGY